MQLRAFAKAARVDILTSRTSLRRIFMMVDDGKFAIFPNLLPIVAVFGLMGAFGISLDTDTLLIAPVIIGIAIDDTIHFLTHYRADLLLTRNINKSIRMTIREAGQAIMFTSIVLSIGFLVFLNASHLAMRNFGVLSAEAITVALITDVLLLPALCMLFNADFGQPCESDDDIIDDTGVQVAA